MNTVLVTGCSSGFGLEIARHFLDRGWRVVATMRTPREDLLPPSPRLHVLALDVADAASVRRAVDAAGPVDVVVNNAGIGMLGAFEGQSLATAREIFETNTLGTFAVTQAVLPQMRERGAGVVVNVTSSVAVQPLPLLAVYTASKKAVEAFSECLALELEPLGVRVRVVRPGRAPATSFAANARPRMEGPAPAAYEPLLQRVFAGFADSAAPVTRAQDVAEAVWRAATDAACPMFLPAGADAVAATEAAGQ